MNLRLFVCVLVVGCFQGIEYGTGDDVKDPCDDPMFIDDARRSVDFVPTDRDALCDIDIDESKWYRLDSYNGGKMPETPVDVYHCGTFRPIWLKGKHPTDKDTTEHDVPPARKRREDDHKQKNKIAIIKTIPVCGVIRQGENCGWTKDIKVKRCLDNEHIEYFVYQLAKPPQCNAAYCAGTGQPCGRALVYNSVTKTCTIGTVDVDEGTELNWSTMPTENITGEMRSDGTPQDLFQIVTVTLVSVFSLFLVVFLTIRMVKCLRGNNSHNNQRTKKENAYDVPERNHAVYTTLALPMESLGGADDQRGSSEYYSQIDESQIREIEAQNSNTVLRPDSYHKLDYSQMREDEEGIANYDQCTTASGPVLVYTYEGRTTTSNSYLELADSCQMRDSVTKAMNIANYEHCTTFDPRPVHTYERRVDVTDQDEDGDGVEPKLSSYDQLKSTHRSKPPKPPVYKRLQIERAQPITSP